MRSDNRRSKQGLQVLRFLDAHRLDPDPMNYAFAYRFLFEADVVMKSEVERIIEGGVRITSREVEKLSQRLLRFADTDSGPQLDRLTLRVLDIIDDAATATGDLNRDLVGAATSLLGPDGPDVRSIIAAMIDRTAHAEASLADATRQAQSLRDELNALRNDATRDRLTGLFNRQAMEERLSAAITSPKGCAIAFIDVDNFKSINDSHGHAVGDRVLQAVASGLVEACSPHTVARWGGEEFLVLLQDTVAADAGAIIDAARAALAARQLKVRENDAPLGAVTFSAGVCLSRGRTVAELVEDADALLYRAKAGGRNRVEVEPVLVSLRTTRKER